LNAPSYHALGDFISKIENSNEIYLISEINIGTSGASQDENKIDLGVNLKINTMSYL
jgi:hypothetical protein